MAWVVAHFIKDNSVEVVPDSWILSKPNGTKECLWPPYTSKLKLFESVRNKSSPDCTWKQYAMNILGRYDDLEVAQRKCRKAEITDELSSTAEFIEEKSNRHIRKQKGTRDDFYYDYDPDRPHFRARKNVSTISNSLTGSDEDNVTTGQQLNRCNDDNLKKTGDMKELLNKLENISEFVNKNYEFQRQVVKDMFLIKCIVKENKEALEGLIKLLPSNMPFQHQEKHKQNELARDTLKPCPIHFEEDLEDLDRKLENEEVMNAVAQELSLIGGDTVKEMTIKVMYYLMSNKIASLYSWEGQKGKRKLKTLKLSQLIIKAIRYRHEKATESEIISRIRPWLVQAKFRDLLKNKRQEQRNEDAK